MEFSLPVALLLIPQSHEALRLRPALFLTDIQNIAKQKKTWCKKSEETNSLVLTVPKERW